MNGIENSTKSENDGKCCKTCYWHDEFSWVCSNWDSPNVADFTDDSESCKGWREK